MTHPACHKSVIQQTFSSNHDSTELLKQSLASSCSSDEKLHTISLSKATLTSLKLFHVVFFGKDLTFGGCFFKSFSQLFAVSP